MSSRDHFKGMRIAVIGIGAHGEMIEDVKYLIKAGAWVSIYDLKSEARLKTSLVALRAVGLANYVCGSIPPDDLIDMDLIVLSHEYPRDAAFLAGLSVPIEYVETLFFKLAPPVTLVGVIGSSGRSTVMSMLKPLLESVCEADEEHGLYVIDQDSPRGCLPYLKKAKNGDIVLMRISDDLSHELHAMRISPQVAVCTSIPAPRSYGESPFEILAYQTYNNFLVASDEVIDAARSMSTPPRAKMLRTKPSYIPDQWDLPVRNPHDRANAALALQAARLFKVDDDEAEELLCSWKPLKGRLEFVKKAKNLEWYNDSSSTTPDAVRAGLIALDIQGKAGVLIFGGADTGHDYRPLYADLATHVHTLVVIPGSGTLVERPSIMTIDGVVTHSAPSIESAVVWISEHASRGDKILFSPGFDAGGVDGSKKERGERFVRAVRGL